MGLAFFGLTYETAPQIRVNLFTQIHEIIFHGNGGYTYEVIYNMPTWLRKFTFNQINNFYQQQKESMEKSQGGNTTNVVDTSGNVDKATFMKNSPYRTQMAKSSKS